jgi:hypothetical protein
MQLMIRAFNNAKVIVFAIFLILTAVAWAYEFLYAIPKQKCEQGGGWWAPKWHACGAPIDLERMPRATGEAPAQTPPKTPPLVKPAAH